MVHLQRKQFLQSIGLSFEITLSEYNADLNLLLYKENLSDVIDIPE
jgi:hypothetical protein